MSDAASAPIVFLAGLAFLYFGRRGWQQRGIIIWQRDGESVHIDGWLGRLLGTILLIAGVASLGLSVVYARLALAAG